MVKHIPFTPDCEEPIEAMHRLLIKADPPEMLKHLAQLVGELLVVLWTFLLAVLDHVIGEVHKRQLPGVRGCGRMKKITYRGARRQRRDS